MNDTCPKCNRQSLEQKQHSNICLYVECGYIELKFTLDERVEMLENQVAFLSAALIQDEITESDIQWAHEQLKSRTPPASQDGIVDKILQKMDNG